MQRRTLMIAAPLVAVATLALSLRLGAKSAVTAVTVVGAPLGKSNPPRLVWQVQTYLDDRGVREVIPIRNLTVAATANGKLARWTGSTNEDGIAEVSLELEGLHEGDALHLDVRQDSEFAPLAAGYAVWEKPLRAEATSAPSEGAARPTRRDGALGIDVLVEGERLVPGFATSVFACANHKAPHIAIEATPEPGLVAPTKPQTTCSDGCAEFPVTAQAHVVGLSLAARSPGGETGTWFGSLPVAPGAFFVGAPRVIPEGAPTTIAVVAPNPRPLVYVEVDDDVGRVAAAALPLVVDPKDSVPRARFDLPPLAAGLHWLVVSGEPRGAEHLAGAAIARPFIVGQSPSTGCDPGPWLARKHVTGFPRWVALDGMAVRGAMNRSRHRWALAIGLGSLFAAAILEAVLLAAAAREARVVMQLAELDDENGTREPITAKPPGGTLFVAILVALLGFGLLAALLLSKA